jgi:hypothetical protein
MLRYDYILYYILKIIYYFILRFTIVWTFTCCIWACFTCRFLVLLKFCISQQLYKHAKYVRSPIPYALVAVRWLWSSAPFASCLFKKRNTSDPLDSFNPLCPVAVRRLWFSSPFTSCQREICPIPLTHSERAIRKRSSLVSCVHMFLSVDQRSHSLRPSILVLK